jgi:hypothetical protein
VPRAKPTTKQIAQRIDLNYFKRPNRWRTWRFALSVLLPCLAVVWLAAYGLARNNRLYSSGKMSPAHAVLTQRCGSCHVSGAGSFRAAASDQACLSCHDGPIHHADQVFTPTCSSCHVEHRGQLRLAATANQSCTQCHSNLRTTGASISYARHIMEFSTGGHPEFAALRSGFCDPGTIKLNHAIHMKANLLGPNGTRVQLDCDDCHRSDSGNQNWRFGTPQTPQPMGPMAAAAAAGQVSPVAGVHAYGPPSRSLARAYMQPATYAKHCIGCHPLPFDKRFAESVPHDTPEVVHAFVVKKFEDYVATHPAELREVKSTIALPTRPLPVSPRVYSTPREWVNVRVAEAEELLWRKTCKQCHSLTFTPGADLPNVAKSNITVRWFQRAVFDHEAHRMWTCTSCHSQATSSQETADVLLPGVRTCEECHHAGPEGAEARCFECHTYHDWTRAKQVKGTTHLSSGIQPAKGPMS